MSAAASAGRGCGGAQGLCVGSYRLTSKGMLEVMLEAADEGLAEQVRAWWAAGRQQ